MTGIRIHVAWCKPHFNLWSLYQAEDEVSPLADSQQLLEEFATCSWRGWSLERVAIVHRGGLGWLDVVLVKANRAIRNKHCEMYSMGWRQMLVRYMDPKFFFIFRFSWVQICKASWGAHSPHFFPRKFAAMHRKACLFYSFTAYMTQVMQ